MKTYTTLSGNSCCIANHQSTEWPEITLKFHLQLHQSLQLCSFVHFITKLLANCPHSVITWPLLLFTLQSTAPIRIVPLKLLSSKGTSYLLIVEPDEQFSVFSYLTRPTIQLTL